jgi:hypothetical protein
MIPLWMVIGYYVGMQPILLQKAARILFWVCIWRSVYALYVFLVVYGGRMGMREYLIDHASSGFLALALGYAGFQAFTQRENTRRLLAYGAAFALILWPYILNDRRTSFVGLMAALLLVPFILPKAIRLRLRSTFRLAVLAVVVLGSYKVVFSKAPANLGQQEQGGEVVDIGNLDYRQIENYNLMIGVIERPLLGLGFGTRFPQAVPLPDISFSFELFDAIPHNTLLYLWTFAGPFGISALMTASCFMMLVLSRVGLGVRSLRLDKEALQTLQNYDWPGNVRELEHSLTRAALRASRATDKPASHVRAEHLDGIFNQSAAGPSGAKNSKMQESFEPLMDSVLSFQKKEILRALNATEGNWAAAARLLGMHRSNLHRLAQRLGIK